MKETIKMVKKITRTALAIYNQRQHDQKLSIFEIEQEIVFNSNWRLLHIHGNILWVHQIYIAIALSSVFGSIWYAREQ